MSRWTPVLPALLAASVLAGCGIFQGGGSAAPPPPEWATRVGADRQVPASGIGGDRRRTRHDAEGAALDESRGQPLGSIVPPEAQQPKSPPAPPS